MADLDPEVVRRLRATWSEDYARGTFSRMPSLSEDIEALLASWERRGEALRQIADGPHGDDPADAANRMIGRARAALEGGKP